MSKRAKQSKLTCFVAFLRLFVATTSLKRQFSSSCSLINMSIFFRQDLGTTVYMISRNAWYHCSTPITNLKLSNSDLILPENTHEQSLVKDQYCSWAGQTHDFIVCMCRKYRLILTKHSSNVWAVGCQLYIKYYVLILFSGPA